MKEFFHGLAELLQMRRETETTPTSTSLCPPHRFSIRPGNNSLVTVRFLVVSNGCSAWRALGIPL